jgi:hypothetical protein
MTPQTQTLTESKQEQTIEDQVQQLLKLYADGPEMGKAALEKALPALMSKLAEGRPAVERTRRSLRQGQVSELTMVVPFAPGGAQRLRALLRLVKGNFAEADRVGTVHDMRFVFLDNDTKFLFATAYDGDFDPYIDDFASKIPNEMDILFTAFEGWPGIHSPEVADWISNHQITAEGWYVANPNLTVRDTRRLERVGKAMDEFLDKVAD